MVSVIDRQGRLTYLTSRRLLGATPGEQPLLREAFDTDFAAERLEIAQQVLDTRRPISVTGMIAGRWILSTYRTLPTDDSTTPVAPGSLRAAVRAATDGAVLSICRPILADRCEVESELPAGTRSMRLHDLGDLAKLNQRELQVLHLIGLGLSSAEIARAVHRSVKAVEWYRGWIAEKLALHDKADAVRFAAGRGLPGISVERWLEVIARQPGGPAFEVHIDADMRRS
jgi:DNA-binding NarL/FixJ family response regulator